MKKVKSNKMKYSRSKLIVEARKEERIKYLLFWGHRPQLDGSIGAGCLSQWWEGTHAFVDEEGQRYPTAEHWMMAGKARLFKDEEVLAQILEATSPAKAKKLGRKVKKFNEGVWRKNRYEIVKEGNLLKFGQHEDLKTFLLNTSNRVLVEASPVDTIWGIGLARDRRDAMNPEKWKGENLLGFALMEVRDVLSENIV